MNIKIKYHADIKPLDIFDKGDWIDLRSAEDVYLNAGDFYILSLGVSMELPKGYYAIIAPRSSTYKKWGVVQANSVGIVDESYCGDNDIWRLPVIAFRATHIYKNDRICQFTLIKKNERVAFEVCKELGNSDRGGFGSTGGN